jgi:multicomponent Na+:H+ antiporter subunit B
MLLRVFRKSQPHKTMYRHTPSGITLIFEDSDLLPKETGVFERIDSEWVPYSVVIKTSCRLIVPFSQIFALYVIAHGHHSPGGGFQGGVILGASIILFAISHTLRIAILRLSEKLAVLLCALGVFIYAGTGLLCLLFGHNYLDYGGLAPLLRVDPVMARSIGILIVEIGVGVSVMAVMIHLYFNIASAGLHDEGV